MNPYLRRALHVLAIFFIVGASVYLGIPGCPLATFFGIPCPSCGMTRATLSALHGDWSAAFHYHPLVFLVVPLVGLYVVAHAISYIRHGSSNVDQSLTGPVATTFVVIVALLLLGVWIARFFGAFGGPVPV